MVSYIYIYASVEQGLASIKKDRINDFSQMSEYRHDGSIFVHDKTTDSVVFQMANMIFEYQYNWSDAESNYSKVRNLTIKELTSLVCCSVLLAHLCDWNIAE